ncbi:PhzF family phenazine biosynthesis protein [Acrocarpospora catenulata]|uniref:PhzF family phenazine biosynthesis protein n=1 Tax=Acrocarpospora catenulata TaxID=2836182 RepID=UPI001BDA7396|nr:PhzF family phenazine biosynthesis protein [Acrocarpospora catenulata]
MRLFTVDSFTDRPFKGNPAAVCLLEAPVTESWMQEVAAEMRHSETAFLLGWEGEQPYSLRWFTPATEVALCGHATLAVAHILYSIGLETGPIAFSTQSGILSVDRDPKGSITMNFPAKPAVPCSPPDGLVSALGVEPIWVGRSEFDLLVEVESAEAVRELNPDIQALATVEARGIIVTAASPDSDADYVSRFFAPRVGVPEDPVTGSAHCVLAPYWSGRLGVATLTAHQLSPRGGQLRTTLLGDRVELAGQAVTIWSGTLLT